MKKLLALLLALSCAATMTACGTKEDDKDDDKEKVEEKVNDDTIVEVDKSTEARAAVEDFLGAISKFDTASAKKYTNDLVATLGFDLQTVLDAHDAVVDELNQGTASSAAGNTTITSAANKLYDSTAKTVLAKAQSYIKCDIQSVEGTGDEYVVSVKMTFPAFDTEPKTYFETLYMNLFSQDTIAEAQNTAKNSATTQDQLMTAYFNALESIAARKINSTEFDTVGSLVKFNVKSVGSDWVISQ